MAVNKLSEADNACLEEFFKGTQKHLSNSVEGLFHPKALPQNTIPELASGQIPIKIVFPCGYPNYETPKAYLSDNKFWLFAHVLMDRGEICPPSIETWLSNPTLKSFLEYLNNFFHKAAENQLELEDDYYELPNFPTFSNRYLLFRTEDCETWLKLEKPQFGVFSFTQDDILMVMHKFNTDAKNLPTDHKKGLYLWLTSEPTIKYKRPPLFYREFFEVLERQGISFLDFINEAQKMNLKNEIVVVVGFPIKEQNNTEPSDVHWQGFCFDMSSYYAILSKQRKKHCENHKDAKKEFQEHILNQPIRYFKTTNCARQSFARIGGAPKIRSVAVFGCGALGSHLLCFLAKAGVPKIYLCDSEVIEPGNICRHALTFSSVGKQKTDDMHKLMINNNPWGEYFCCNNSVLKFPDSADNIKELMQCDFWIDAGLPFMVSSYLNTFAKANLKRMISAFITNKGKFLLIAISGNDSAPDIETVLIRGDEYATNNKNPELMECFNLLKSPKKDLGIRPNAGCYFLTFEASGAKIASASAIIYSNINHFAGVNFEQGKLLIYHFDENYFVYKGILSLDIES